MKAPYPNCRAMAAFLLSFVLFAATSAYADEETRITKEAEDVPGEMELYAFTWAIYQFHLVDSDHVGIMEYLDHFNEGRGRIDVGDAGPTLILGENQCHNEIDNDEFEDGEDNNGDRKGVKRKDKHRSNAASDRAGMGKDEKFDNTMAALIYDTRSYIAFRHSPRETDLPKGFIYSLHSKGCRFLFRRKNTTNLIIRFKRKASLDIGRGAPMPSAIVEVIKNCGDGGDGLEKWELAIVFDRKFDYRGLVFRRNLVYVDCPRLKRAIEKAKGAARQRQLQLDGYTTDVEDNDDRWDISFPPLAIRPGGSLHVIISKKMGEILKIYATE